MAIGIIPNARNQFIDINGKPLVGGAVYMYVPDTLVPKDTWQDINLTILNTNPIILDSAGQCNIWGNGQYRQRVFDSLGNLIWDYNTETPPDPVIPAAFVVAEATADGNGGVPSTGIFADCIVPVACTLKSAYVQALSSGSVVVDIWAAPFVVNTPPTLANSIVASDPPTLSSAQSSVDNILSGWTTSIAANTALRFRINSIGTLTHFTVSLVASIP
jgi:hypothetical protein